MAPVKCFSSSVATCWRKSSVDHSVFAAPTIVSSDGGRSGLGLLGHGGQEQPAREVAGGSEEDHSLAHGGSPFSDRSA